MWESKVLGIGICSLILFGERDRLHCVLTCWNHHFHSLERDLKGLSRESEQQFKIPTQYLPKSDAG